MIDDDEDAVHRVNISDCKSSTVSLHSYSGPFWRTFEMVSSCILMWTLRESPPLPSTDALNHFTDLIH